MERNRKTGDGDGRISTSFEASMTSPVDTLSRKNLSFGRMLIRFAMRLKSANNAAMALISQMPSLGQTSVIDNARGARQTDFQLVSRRRIVVFVLDAAVASSAGEK
jgi:hypothetical protein